eukprot:TRINITY_DN9636_c0_g1_i1.p1 TRINITY_DN9636_c0_g1~~TRINITY_DN9636_c0_g1_i1.p1  ORF type:complete len:412 (+),score=55.55 TRINITY_DN9636_c0_g1_i1:88-1236(+)
MSESESVSTSEGVSGSVTVSEGPGFPLELLPEDILAETLFHLSDEALLRCTTVCTYWLRLIERNEHWRRRFIRVNGELGPLSSQFYYYLAIEQSVPWKQLYREASWTRTDDFFSVESDPPSQSSPAVGEINYEKFIYYMRRKHLLTTNESTMRFEMPVLLMYGKCFHFFEHHRPSLNENNEYRMPGEPTDSERPFTLLMMSSIVKSGFPLAGGRVFPLKPERKSRVCQEILKELEFCEEAQIDVGDLIQYFPLYTFVYSCLDPNHEVEAELREVYKGRVIDILNALPDSNRTKYYNLACVYSMFGMLEEAEKFLRWTFNYKDGEYESTWAGSFFNRTADLLQSAEEYDADFDSVRSLPWFQAIIKEAHEDAAGRKKLPEFTF